MYKILIKTKSSKNYYVPYKIMDEETEEITQEYETDDLQELAETFKDLLNIYPISDLKPIQELEAELLVSIVD